MSFVLVFCLSLVQNISFTMASRSRNRSSMTYHAICAVFANALWFVTTQQLVMNDLGWSLFLPYVLGTVAGSLVGGKVSMLIEERIGARC